MAGIQQPLQPAVTLGVVVLGLRDQPEQGRAGHGVGEMEGDELQQPWCIQVWMVAA